MSSDFAEMLKDTLTKMQERIEFANKQWEDENDISMLKKFEDMPGRWKYLIFNLHHWDNNCYGSFF